MNEERFDELMRDAAHTYRTPPEAPIDEMWADIEQRVARQQAPHARSGRSSLPRRSWRAPRWLMIAATLVVGIGLGRASAYRPLHPATQAVAAPVFGTPVARADGEAVSKGYQLETSRYLGQTAALLIALPSEARNGRANEQFVGRAGELLTTTRLLIDSPAASDPAMRNLLEDLELVLAQVVRLQSTNSRTDLDLINRALEQRDVLPRLRTAAGDLSAN